METTLHQQLKKMYAGEGARSEVRVDGYRIDAICNDELIEVQLGSLGALRDKIRKLLANGHRVRIVKPLIQQKWLVRLTEPNGQLVSRRRSPKRESALDLFAHLINFTQIFPHPRLTLDVPWIEVEETRYPGHGKRRRWRENDFITADLKLLEVFRVDDLRKSTDLVRWLNVSLPKKFHTGDLAKLLTTSRPIAQRIAYCLRQCGAADVIGKEGNAIIYRPKRVSRKAAA